MSVSGTSRGVRDLAGRVARRARRVVARERYVPGLLSVVVPVYAVEEFIDDCLRSLRDQDYRDVEIVVVDDGSPDGSRQIAERHAREDPRVRIITRPNGGLSAARNTGVAHARGEFLTFIDSDDEVDARAFAAPVAALQQSGSDFAVTSYQRLRRGEVEEAGSWIRAVHVRRRLRCTLADFPEIQVNALACSKVFRRSFYDRAGLRFTEGAIYEDQPVASRAYARARSFDVLPDIGVLWRARDDMSSISQQNATVANLSGHTRSATHSLTELREAGHDAAAELRTVQLLQHNLVPFVDNIHRGGADFVEELRSAVIMLVRQAPRDLYLRGVDARKKVIYHLLAERRDDELMEFLGRCDRDMRHYRTRVQAGRASIALPVADGSVPDDCLLLSDDQLVLSTMVTQARWEDARRLYLEGWSFIAHVDLAEHRPQTSLTLVSPTGDRQALRPEQQDSWPPDWAGQHWYCDYRPGGFAVTVDVAELAEVPGSWRIEVQTVAGGVRRTGLLQLASRVARTVRQPSVVQPGRTVLLEADEARELVLTTTHAPVHLTGRRFDDDVLHAEGVGPGVTTLMLTGPRADDVVATCAVEQLGGDRWRAELALGPLREAPPGEARSYHLSVRSGDGEVTRLSDAPGLLDEGPVPGLRFFRGPGGQVRVVHDPRGCLVRSAEVDGTDLLLRLVLGEVSRHEVTPVLSGPLASIAGSWDERAEAGEQVARIPLHMSRWGGPDLPLPLGRYDLALRPRDGAPDLAAPLSQDLLHRLPELTWGAGLRVVLLAAGPRSGTGLRVFLEPPLPDEQRSARAQQVLREQTRVPRAGRASVFFRSLYGEVAHGNALAVHHELRRRGCALTLYWSVTDHSVPVPDGGQGVIEGSPEWHEALFGSRYHMVDVHQLPWFEKPRDQVLIQTMHGYPYKLMGHDLWQKRGLSRAQVESYDRRAREWDYFVSPASYATPLLEQAFLTPAGASAELLEIGYPRNDVLQSPAAEKIRTRTRDRLGIGPNGTAVLYAPTFRDYLSTNDMRARHADFFDPEEVIAALPDDVFVLMRGHAFHARMRNYRRAGAERILDVTDYPDVNDLILASDVAVLDYSSLRFDYALTDKPMVFLVPDAAKYDEVRGGVIPFAPTAPGPHVSSTDEVISHLKDLDVLRSSFAADRRRFRADYTELDDGHAAARLVDAVFVPRGDAPPA